MISSSSPQGSGVRLVVARPPPADAGHPQGAIKAAAGSGFIRVNGGAAAAGPRFQRAGSGVPPPRLLPVRRTARNHIRYPGNSGKEPSDKKEEGEKS